MPFGSRAPAARVARVRRSALYTFSIQVSTVDNSPQQSALKALPSSPPAQDIPRHSTLPHTTHRSSHSNSNSTLTHTHIGHRGSRAVSIAIALRALSLRSMSHSWTSNGPSPAGGTAARRPHCCCSHRSPWPWHTCALCAGLRMPHSAHADGHQQVQAAWRTCVGGACPHTRHTFPRPRHPALSRGGRRRHGRWGRALKEFS